MDWDPLSVAANAERQLRPELSTTPLDEFLAYELDDYVRSQLLEAMSQMLTGQRYFTYNVFNVLLDADRSTVTIEDELDPSRESVLDLQEFGAVLRSGDRVP